MGGGSSRSRRINKSANIEEDERLFLENQKQQKHSQEIKEKNL